MLDLQGCSQLPEVNLDEFESLTYLSLSNTKITKLTLKKVPKLKMLDLQGC